MVDLPREVLDGANDMAAVNIVVVGRETLINQLCTLPTVARSSRSELILVVIPTWLRIRFEICFWLASTELYADKNAVQIRIKLMHLGC